MAFERLRDDMRRWGVFDALYMRVVRRVERYAGIHLFVINARPLDADAPRDPVPAGCEARVLTESELIAFARDPALGLTEAGVAQACARDDVCVGYLDHGRLVSYTWSARAATPAEAGLWVRFAEGHSYGYKALTLPSHRGRHLQECVVHVLDRWLTARGARYNIDYIRTDNLASIAADRRYGNVAIGYAGYFRAFGRVRPFRTRGVKARGFEFFVPEQTGAGE